MFDNKAELAEKIISQRDSLGLEGFISQTYALTADPRLISSSVPLSERSYLAFTLLIQTLKSKRKISSPFAKEETPQETTGEPKKATVLVPNYYETLGVSETAGKEDIRKAYRELMKEFHPDKLSSKGITLSLEEKEELVEWTKDINIASGVLSSADNRADYDALIAQSNVETFTPGPPSFLTEAAKSAVGKVAGEVTKKVVGGVAEKVAGQIATKTGQAVVVAGAEAAGVAATGPAAPITFVLIEVGKKILGAFKNAFSAIARFFKSEDSKELRWAGSVGTLVGGILLLNAGVVFGLPLIALGGLATLGMLAAAGAGAQIAGFGASILSGLTAVVIPAIGIPILVALVSVPVIIALILFIINSGAYIVPPRPETALAITNPYIDISKSADDSEFENSELPVTITYTIEIRARRSTLSNIRFQSECRVIQEGGNPPCPPITNITVNGQPSSVFPPIPPPIISPVGDAYIITYQQIFTGSFQDSLVTDTFTIIADVPEELNTEASASAGVRIGNPPDECPNGWPVFPYASEGSLLIIQGPRGLFTHTRVEAIDIRASNGHPVIATHTGVASGGPGGVYGTSVRISSSCGGISFSTIYGHLDDIDVDPGDTVVMGQTIGTSDTTGTDNPHLHYEFSPSTSIPMAPPYIPKSVPYGCYYLDPCNVTVP